MKYFDMDTRIMHSGDTVDNYTRCGVRAEAMILSSPYDHAQATTCLFCSALERAEPKRIRPGGFDFEGGLKEW